MAISPEEAATLSDTEREIVDKQEREIDEWLRQSYFPGCGPLNYPIQAFTSRIIGVLLERYRRAGWVEVELNDTSRRHHIIFEEGAVRT